MKTVLSTKILTLPQKELLLNSGIGFVEYNALDISFMSIEIPNDIFHIIISSKNGAKAFLKNYESKKDRLSKTQYHFYCVGEKTKLFLEDFGFTVVASCPNSYELGSLISKKYKTNQFVFISGNLRRAELPDLLSKNNIQYIELDGYTTKFKKKTFDTSFDGILFFSPSGIKSYTSANSIYDTPLFCIGNTTAAEAQKHSKNIQVANKPTVENVLVQVVKYFKKND